MTSRSHRRTCVVLFVVAVMAPIDIAQAQGIMLARQVIGRIEQMSQTSPSGGTTYDTASVIVDVPIDRVYAAVKTQVATAQGIKISREDAAARRIEFTDGTRIAGIQAIALADNLTQLMVSSAHASGPQAPTPMIVQHIVAACKAMNVQCYRPT
jgi:hypothetical protein